MRGQHTIAPDPCGRCLHRAQGGECLVRSHAENPFDAGDRNERGEHDGGIDTITEERVRRCGDEQQKHHRVPKGASEPGRHPRATTFRHEHVGAVSAEQSSRFVGGQADELRRHGRPGRPVMFGPTNRARPVDGRRARDSVLRGPQRP